MSKFGSITTYVLGGAYDLIENSLGWCNELIMYIKLILSITFSLILHLKRQTYAWKTNATYGQNVLISC